MTPTRFHILFVDQFGTLGGGQKALLAFIRSLDTKRFKCVAALNGHGNFREKLLQDGFEITALPLGNYGSRKKTISEQARFLVRTLICTFHLISSVRRQKIDLIYANSPRTFFCATLAAVFTRVPLLWHLHSVLPSGSPRFLAGFFSRWTTRLITCSRATALPLLQIHPSLEGKLRIVPNPRPLQAESMSREDALKALGLPQLKAEGVGFGIIGRITPFKGQLQFLQAAALVAKKRAEVNFWVIGSPAPGDPEDLRYLRQLIHFTEDACLNSSVIFVPYQDDIAICYSLFDILVIASQGEEGLPLCALEGLSFGKPVIGPKNGGLREILENGSNSLLLDEVHPEGLAGKMMELLGSAELRRQFSQNARNRISSWMTPIAFGRKLEQILTESLEQ